MVIYQNYTTVEGVERVKAFSDKSVYIERGGELYGEADDFVYQNRKYAETDIPIEPVEPTDEAKQKAETDRCFTPFLNKSLTKQPRVL